MNEFWMNMLLVGTWVREGLRAAGDICLLGLALAVGLVGLRARRK